MAKRFMIDGDTSLAMEVLHYYVENFDRLYGEGKILAAINLPNLSIKEMLNRLSYLHGYKEDLPISWQEGTDNIEICGQLMVSVYYEIDCETVGSICNYEGAFLFDATRARVSSYDLSSYQVNLGSAILYTPLAAVEGAEQYPTIICPSLSNFGSTILLDPICDFEEMLYNRAHSYAIMSSIGKYGHPDWILNGGVGSYPLSFCSDKNNMDIYIDREDDIAIGEDSYTVRNYSHLKYHPQDFTQYQTCYAPFSYGELYIYTLIVPSSANVEAFCELIKRSVDGENFTWIEGVIPHSGERKQNSIYIYGEQIKAIDNIGASYKFIQIPVSVNSEAYMARAVFENLQWDF